MNLFLKQFVLSAAESTSTRKEIIRRATEILAHYHEHLREPCDSGRILLPDRCVLLPLLFNSLINCDMIAVGREMAVEDRMFNLLLVMAMNVETSQRYLYPSIIPLLDPVQPQSVSKIFFLKPLGAGREQKF